MDSSQFDSSDRQAATALIVRKEGDDLLIPFILRSKRENDPWSGDMSLPGGHVDLADTSGQFTAIRETEEEIGLALDADLCFGSLPAQQSMRIAGRRRMQVTPYVFGCKHEFEVRLSGEVAELVWGSLREMISGEVDSVQMRGAKTSKSPFNGFLLHDRYFVWGLTYRTLQTFFQVLDPSYSVRGDATKSLVT